MKSPRPESDTSFESLQRAPASPAVDYAVKGEKREETEFQALNRALAADAKPYQYRSATDHLIDVFTPIMIFIMVYSVIFFLLEVRYIYSEVHDKNLKMVTFFFLLGILALNRLIAREGTDESMLYVVLFTGAIGLYTLATTSGYAVGSLAVTFLDRPWVATFFNMIVVAIIWWTTNRLMHECSIDENRTAGDVGILTGTAIKWRQAIQRIDPENRPKPVPKPRHRRKDHLLEAMDLEAYDPLEYRPKLAKAATQIIAPAQRLAKRHPGISIIYYSIPVMVIFALGLPVLMAGGERWVMAGHWYVGVYTVTALFLLMTTSLGGLREYFRARRVYFPGGIGWFWFGLGTAMIAAVSVGALQLPMPPMPAMANIVEHETDPFAGPSRFQLQSAAVTASQAIEQTRFVERVGQGVLIGITLFFAFFAVRAAGNVAALIGRYRDRCPAFIVRFFDRLDAFLARVIRVPHLPTLPRRIRVAREKSVAIRYRNPMEGAGLGTRADVQGHIAYAYDALCALAEDLGVPRRKDETPFEFINAFPRVLKNIKDDAYELTVLYVQSAYSADHLDEHALDRLRKFWISYDQARRRIIK